MKFLIVLAALVAAAACWSIPSEEELANHWQAFKADHAKNYASAAEEAHRMSIFKENAIRIARHNARFDAGAVSFQVGIHKRSDMLSHEVAAQLSSFRPSIIKRGERRLHNVSALALLPSLLPEIVDWRTRGYVTPVKDQGDCRAGWAFSTTGSLEGAMFQATGNLLSLSEQNLLDCSSDNNTCRGGVVDLAFQYIIDNGGIDTEASYPYTGEQGSCQYAAENVGASMTSFVDVEQGSERALQDAVKRVGPVSAAIDASHFSFQAYKRGIYYEESCSSEVLDHGVLVVGYGALTGVAGPILKTDWWIVKNSWGADWGEGGYIRMARNRNNNCGIASAASYPVA